MVYCRPAARAAQAKTKFHHRPESRLSLPPPPGGGEGLEREKGRDGEREGERERVRERGREGEREGGREREGERGRERRRERMMIDNIMSFIRKIIINVRPPWRSM